MPLAWPLEASQIQSVTKSAVHWSDCLLEMLCYLLRISPVDKLSAAERTSLHSQPLEIVAVLLLWKVALHGTEQTVVPRLSGNIQNPGRIGFVPGRTGCAKHLKIL